MGWVLSNIVDALFCGVGKIFLVLFLFMEWLGVSKKYLYYRLNEHVLFVLQANLKFLLGGFLRSILGKYY